MRQTIRFVPALAFLALTLLAQTALAQQVNSVRGPVERPVPLQILDAPTQDKAQAPESAPQGQGKFKNIDTAKNRKDYEMGTDSGADSIRLGRDEETGDTVMSHTPPKQKPQQNPLEGQPIQVRPVIPMR